MWEWRKWRKGNEEWEGRREDRRGEELRLIDCGLGLVSLCLVSFVSFLLWPKLSSKQYQYYWYFRSAHPYTILPFFLLHHPSSVSPIYERVFSLLFLIPIPCFYYPGLVGASGVYTLSICSFLCFPMRISSLPTHTWSSLNTYCTVAIVQTEPNLNPL